jgi:predicted house-cleaning noncanonical NTP pyrophosphatase (MazG superfamily)
MKYGKLVRDRIPEIIKSKGKSPRTHIAEDFEYFDKLKNKLKEEVEEFVSGGDIEELADILEVIDAIKDFKKIDDKKLNSIKEKKFDERGGFNEKIILDEVEDN